MAERRKYPRAEVSFPVECSILSQPAHFCTVTQNLSLVGVRMLSDQFIPKDTPVKININLIDSIISIKAKVVWCNKNRISERYSQGLEFTEVTPAHQSDLLQFLQTANLS